MIRGIILFLMIAFAPLAPAKAQSVVDRIVFQLNEQGYREIEISRTLLGRTRIEARNRGGRREIVVNPRTGLILRDYFYRNGKSGRLRDIFDDDYDDDDDDDGDDDDDDDDDDDRGNSGKGSRNSGSGSSNSGKGSGNSGSGSGKNDDD